MPSHDLLVSDNLGPKTHTVPLPLKPYLTSTQEAAWVSYVGMKTFVLPVSSPRLLDPKSRNASTTLHDQELWNFLKWRCQKGQGHSASVSPGHSKCDPAAAAASPGSLWEMQIPWPLPRPSEMEFLGWGPRNLYYNKFSRIFLCLLNFRSSESCNPLETW